MPCRSSNVSYVDIVLTLTVREWLDTETENRLQDAQAGKPNELKALLGLGGGPLLRTAVLEASNLVYKFNDRDQKTFRLRSPSQYAMNVT